MKKLIIIIAAITGLVAPLLSQNNFMEQYVSPEVISSVTNFDVVSTNANQLEGNQSNLQFYVQFEDGPLVWFTTHYESTMQNLFEQFLVNRNFVSTPYYYKYTGGYSNKISLPLTTKYEMETCFINWGKIVDAGFINNQSQTISLLQNNKTNNNNITKTELITRK